MNTKASSQKDGERKERQVIMQKVAETSPAQSEEKRASESVAPSAAASSDEIRKLFWD